MKRKATDGSLGSENETGGNPAIRLVVEVPIRLHQKVAKEAEELGVPVEQRVVELVRGWFRAHHPVKYSGR